MSGLPRSGYDERFCSRRRATTASRPLPISRSVEGSGTGAPNATLSNISPPAEAAESTWIRVIRFAVSIAPKNVGEPLKTETLKLPSSASPTPKTLTK